MKLDFSKLTAHIQKSVGHGGQRGQPITARLPVSPSRKKLEGTTGDKLASGGNCLELVDICPPPSPVCPPTQNHGKPCNYRVSPVSPLSPVFLGDIGKTATDLPVLCELFGLSWERVEDAGILAPYDRGMIDAGAYNALWVIRYLLSWRAGGYFVPFGLLRDDEIAAQLKTLGLVQPDAETVSQWLAVNISNKTGDGL